MSKNQRGPLPAPGPLCAFFEPQLSLLVHGKLDATETADLRAHLADCEYCQWRLQEYDILLGALHRHFGVAHPLEQSQGGGGTSESTGERSPDDAIPPLLTMEEIIRAAAREEAPPASSQQRPQRPEPPVRRRLLTTWGAIAAALLVVSLAAALFAQLAGFGLGGRSTLDPQSQAYVSILRTYYQPLFVAISLDTDCESAYAAAAANRKLDALLNCRATSASVITGAQALAEHLANAHPPARWQQEDAQLKQAVAATITIYGLRVAAIDAHSTSQFDALMPQTHSVLSRFCAPIARINADLPPSDTFNGPKFIC